MDRKNFSAFFLYSKKITEVLAGMKVTDIIKTKKPVVAFEIFPPKLESPIEAIYDTLNRFRPLNPDYISVTDGAGGSAKGRTIEVALKIKRDYGIESMAHFTCIGQTRENVDKMLGILHKEKIENILALRGDIPKDMPDFDFSAMEFRYAADLTRYIRSKNGFCIAVAAYVEGHSECERIKEDLMHLKEKVDAGADFLVTQLFFDNRMFYDFMDRIEALGIDCPVLPGIMPVFCANQIKNFAVKCGCSFPAKLVLAMDKFGENREDMTKAGIEFATQQICDLLENGVPGIHLFTMNRPEATREILVQSGLRKQPSGNSDSGSGGIS